MEDETDGERIKFLRSEQVRHLLRAAIERRITHREVDTAHRPSGFIFSLEHEHNSRLDCPPQLLREQTSFPLRLDQRNPLPQPVLVYILPRVGERMIVNVGGEKANRGERSAREERVDGGRTGAAEFERISSVRRDRGREGRTDMSRPVNGGGEEGLQEVRFARCMIQRTYSSLR
jgi:hypothetical protein